jgi:hypothetical protein
MKMGNHDIDPHRPHRPGMKVMADEEFLAAVADQGKPPELNKALLELRRTGRIQIFDDGTGDPLLVLSEQLN